MYVDEREIDLQAKMDRCLIYCPTWNIEGACGTAPIQRQANTGMTLELGMDGRASNNDLSIVGEIRHEAMLGKVHADDPSGDPGAMAIRMMPRGSAALALAEDETDFSVEGGAISVTDTGRSRRVRVDG